MTTDKPKPPAKPGMEEVSAKFVDAAEAATAAPPSSASVTDDSLVALGRQWKEVYGKWVEADVYPDTSDRGAIRKYEKERTVLLLAISQLEDQAAEVAAQTVDGVLAQLRMAGTHYHLMERDGEQWANTYAKLTWQAWDGLERLVGKNATAVPASVTEPTDPVVLLGQCWEEIKGKREQLKNRDDENPKHPDVIEDERLHDIQLDIEKSIADTFTRTAAGVAVKLRHLQRDDEVFDGMSDWHPAAFRTALEALARIEG